MQKKRFEAKRLHGLDDVRDCSRPPRTFPKRTVSAGKANRGLCLTAYSSEQDEAGPASSPLDEGGGGSAPVAASHVRKNEENRIAGTVARKPDAETPQTAGNPPLEDFPPC